MCSSTQPYTLTIRLLAGLKKYNPTNEEIVVYPGDTIADIITRLGINRELVSTAFLDGRFIDFDKRIERAEKLLLLPAIGGG